MIKSTNVSDIVRKGFGKIDFEKRVCLRVLMTFIEEDVSMYHDTNAYLRSKARAARRIGSSAAEEIKG